MGPPVACSAAVTPGCAGSPGRDQDREQGRPRLGCASSAEAILAVLCSSPTLRQAGLLCFLFLQEQSVKMNVWAFLW